MSQTLGEKLRQAREERGISASEVAEQTRISPIYIDAIERDDYKPLPGGIFNKGFVKTFAKYVGIDENEALQDYARIIAQTEGAAHDDLRVYRPEVLTDDNSTSSMIPTIIFAGIILALMTGGILFVLNYLQNNPERPPTANIANSNTVNQVAEPPPAPATNFDRIDIEFNALSEKVNVESSADGISTRADVLPGTPKVYSGSESVTLRYYKGFANMVEFVLNGKKIEAPPAPARGNLISVTVNRSNIRQIWESGSFAPLSETQAATPTSSPAGTPESRETPAATPTAPPATPIATRTPAPRPSPTRTPVVVSNSARPATNRP